MGGDDRGGWRALEALAAYLPMDRRQAASRDQRLPEKTVGAVVFADVSGFTLLTETLGRALGSQRGAEELSWQLNRVYSGLIAEVHARRGSVIGFSGDAITCWFDGDDGRRATACALDMQRVMAEQHFTTADGSAIRLAIKVAVSQGPVRRLEVGDPRIRVFDVVAGATLERVATAEQLAQQGEVVVDSRSAAALGDAAQVSELRTAEGQSFAVIEALAVSPPRDPWPVLATDALTDEQVRPYLDPEVYERLRTGMASFLAEIRSVVPLFLSFEGLDFDRDDEVGVKLDHYLREVQAIVHRFEGSLIDLTTGDKGTYLFISFGALVAHEDDATRAVAAALELRELSLRTSNIREPRIGLSQGRLHAGPSGSATRQTYTALGDETNLAARLMSRARSGQILASDRIALATAQSFRFRNLGALVLKGKKDPLTVHEVLDSRTTQTTAPNSPNLLVGRRQERELFDGLLSRLIHNSEYALAILEGEAGIGKSCLLETVLEQARTEGLDPFVGAADAVENATPYYAWRPIWRSLFKLGVSGSSDERQQVIDVVAALSDPRSTQLAPLLNPVLTLDLEPTQLSAQLHGEPRAESTRELLLALLRHFARRQPLFLVLEDAHWLDSASWDLVDAIARDTTPLVLFLAIRPGTMAAGMGRHQLLTRPGTTRVRLKALAQAEVLALVSERLGVSELPEPVADLLRKKTDGNPFFSEELAFALRDTGLIRIEDGCCQLAPGVDALENLDFPETIEGVVTSRIDRLSAAEQLTVKVASVVGRVFARNLVRDIYPVASDRHYLASHLDHLEQLDITRPLSPAPVLHYIFKHIITQEVAYNRMLLFQRRQLHRAVAQWYELQGSETQGGERGFETLGGEPRGFETRGGGDHRTAVTKLSPLLAHHWSQAIEGMPNPSPEHLSKAIRYLEAAGEQALRDHASREAIRYLDQALALNETWRSLADDESLAATAERRSRWHAGLGRSHLALGELKASRSHYLEALALLGRPVPRRRGHLLVATLGTVASQIWLNLRPVGRRRPLTSQLQDKLLAASRICSYLAEIHWFANDQLGFLFYAVRFANLSMRAGPSPELAESCAGMSMLTCLRPLRFTGDLYSRRIDEIDPALVPASTRIRILILTSVADYSLGRWGRVREKLPEACKICEQLGDWHHWAEAKSMLGMGALHEGNLDLGREHLDALAAAGRARNHPRHVVWGLSNLAILALRQGHPELATTLIDEAQPYLDSEEDRIYAILCYGQLALARLRLGNPTAALNAVDQASEQIHQTAQSPSPVALRGYTGTAEARFVLWRQAIHAGRPAEELKTLATAARRAYLGVRAMGRMYSIGRPDAWGCAGTLAELSGRPRRARRAWRKSLAAAEELKMPYEQARAHLELGRCLPDTDPAGSRHLEQGRQILRRLGCDETSIAISDQPSPRRRISGATKTI